MDTQDHPKFWITADWYRRFLLKMIFSFLLLFSSILVHAQGQFPVQIQPRVNFPSVYLSDYTHASNLNVRVYLADLNKIAYKVNIKVRLTSSSVNLVSQTPLQLTLDGGQVYFLNEEDLAFLFKPSNLGSTTNSLKEGVYTLSFEAEDYTISGLKVSNIATDFAMFSVN